MRQSNALADKLVISEVFGFGVENSSFNAIDSRSQKLCPFRNTKCTKSSKSDPIGICTLSDGSFAAAICPTRFLEKDKIFKDAARIAFGDGVEIGIFPEVRILKISGESTESRERKIGKVDFILGQIENGKVIDFAALEVQAVYFSGTEIRSALRYFLDHTKLDLDNSSRRPDFRSSAQKRLMPQLQLKVPVFRRWGKKFFIVVDTLFFKALPSFTEAKDAANSEITWLCYPISKSGTNYELGEANIHYSEWDEVRNALREGEPPDPAEVLTELQSKLDSTGRNTKLLIT